MLIFAGRRLAPPARSRLDRNLGLVMIALWVVSNGCPTWADFRLSVFAGLAYLAIVLAINIMLGFNYGYVGNAQPGEAPIIDFLGPWPQRVGVMAILVIGVMALLMLPWHAARRMRGTKEAHFR